MDRVATIRNRVSSRFPDRESPRERIFSRQNWHACSLFLYNIFNTDIEEIEVFSTIKNRDILRKYDISRQTLFSSKKDHLHLIYCSHSFDN